MPLEVIVYSSFCGRLWLVSGGVRGIVEDVYKQ